MIVPKIKTTAADALVGLWRLSLTSFIIATLYLARALLIPLALSALLTFLLAPPVTWMERWIGRIAAVLLVVMLIFTAAASGGWVLTRQLVELATKLPDYKGNIIAKMHSFELPKGGIFAKLSETVEELKKELPGGPASAAPMVTQETGKPGSIIPSPPQQPATVSVPRIEPSNASPVELVQLIVSPLVGPLGMAALVFVLVIFMLLQREDLRNRLIRLIGLGRISATTRALEDAGHRVSRYLLMQLLVNVTYGVVIALGLYFIGVPNSVLWGAFGTVLRFIPYIGPWVAAVLPTLLALAVSPRWTMPILTLGLFGVLELLLNNVMEPWLYGAHTGVSSIALIVAAVFWTWLWGPLGLVLATPLTVCLVVMGRHIPRLSFLGVVLSDEEALTPAEDCYQRMLTPGDRDEWELVEAYLKGHSLTELYDSVFLPVLIAAESDAQRQLIDPTQLMGIEQSLRDLIEDLDTRQAELAKALVGKEGEATAAPPAPARVGRAFCLPARAERDELAGSMLVQLLSEAGFEAQNAPAKLGLGELVALADKENAEVLCISVVSPSTVIQARHLSRKLRGRLPLQKIVVGLWGGSEGLPETAKGLRDSGADEVVSTFAEALVQIAQLAPTSAQEPNSEPVTEKIATTLPPNG